MFSIFTNSLLEPGVVYAYLEFDNKWFINLEELKELQYWNKTETPGGNVWLHAVQIWIWCNQWTFQITLQSMDFLKYLVKKRYGGFSNKIKFLLWQTLYYFSHKFVCLLYHAGHFLSGVHNISALPNSDEWPLLAGPSYSRCIIMNY